MRLPLYGLLAEFDRPESLLAAAAAYRRLSQDGRLHPLPVEGLADAIGLHQTRVPLLVLARRHYRRSRRLLPAVLDSVIDYPDQCRRPAAATVGHRSFP